MSRDTERACLGAIFQDPAVFPLVAATINARDFAYEPHRRLYDLLAGRVQAGKPIGIIELVGDLGSEAWGLLGGAAYVAELPEACPSPTNAGYYAEQIRRASLVHGLQRLAQSLGKDVQGGSDPSGVDPVQVAETYIRRLTEMAAPVTRSYTLAETWDEAERERGGEFRIPTGFPELDAMLDGGWTPGDAIVIGARPSMGKTALALAMAAASSEHVPVGFASLEMRRPRIGDRLWSMVSSVPHSAVRTGHRTAEQTEVLRDWRKNPPNIRLWHEPGATLAQVTAQIRRWWAVDGIRVAVVDYLTLLREPPAYPGEGKPERVGRTMQALKDLGAQLGVVIIVLSQLNRNVEERAPRRGAEGVAWWTRIALPNEGDLVWSSEVEAITDVLMFPLRADRTGIVEPNLQDAAVLYVLKNRNGPTGFVPAKWHGPTASYLPYRRYDHWPQP